MHKRNNNFIFLIDEVVNTKCGKIKILEQTYLEHKKNSDKFEKGYKYKCLLCGNVDFVKQYDLYKQKIGCNVCCNSPRKVVKEINSVWKTNPEILKYFVDIKDSYENTISSSKIIKLKCLNCGSIKEISLNGFKNKNFKFPCSKCGDGVSYYNKFIYSLFSQLGINFQNEKRFNWCVFKNNYNNYKKGIYDFYFELNDKKYIVEMDGQWHRKNNGISGQTKEESQFIDNEKDRLANEHGIEVIRIDCEKSELEWIKNKILDSKLNRLYNLNNVDWNECHKYACNSLVIKACELWNKGIRSSIEISKLIGRCKNTTVTYLNMGREIGLCDYNGDEIKAITKSNNGKMRAEPVEVFKNGVSLGIYPSATYIAENSEKLFDEKLFQGHISSVCRNEKNQYKGFYFKKHKK